MRGAGGEWLSYSWATVSFPPSSPQTGSRLVNFLCIVTPSVLAGTARAEH